MSYMKLKLTAPEVQTINRVHCFKLFVILAFIFGGVIGQEAGAGIEGDTSDAGAASSSAKRAASSSAVVAGRAGTSGAEQEVGSPAEWAPPKIVLMHTPGIEQFFGVIQPEAALYERGFNLERAAKQHNAFVSLLKEQGAKVHLVKEVLLEGTRGEAGDTIETPQTEDLRELAAKLLIVDGTASMASDSNVGNLRALSAESLVDIILLRPRVHVSETKTNTHRKATYEAAPLMNLMFLRDQLITTRQGIVLGRMHSPQREHEPLIIKFVLQKLGVKPIYEMLPSVPSQPEAYLEGGDFLSADNVSFIGQGLRTNPAAVHLLLNEKVFGTDYVAVVRDPWKNQQEMHLDTYFNIIDRDLAVLSEWRQTGYRGAQYLPTLVDVYKLNAGKTAYVYEKGLLFVKYLEELGFQIIPVTSEDQKRYGINFLTVGSRKILAVDGVSRAYKEMLRAHKVDATWMDFSAITGGYGAAHCITQPILRQFLLQQDRTHTEEK